MKNLVSHFKSTYIVLLLTLAAQHLALAEVHTIRVLAHSFSPRQIEINVGDTVVWKWETNFHNVVSYTDANGFETGAFRSDLQNKGTSFSVLFDDNLLSDYQPQNNTFFYVCEPHVNMGMTGSIKVRQPPVALRAEPSSWQTTKSPPQSNESELIVDLVLSKEEGRVYLSNLSGSEEVEDSSIELFVRGSNSNVIALCQFETAVEGTSCLLDNASLDSILRGDAFVRLNNLTGQIFRYSQNSHKIEGRIVPYQEGSSVTLLPLGIVTIPSKVGTFKFTNIPNGVYFLKPWSEEFVAVRSNLVLVNSEDVLNYDFERSVPTIPQPNPTIAITPTPADPNNEAEEPELEEEEHQDNYDPAEPATEPTPAAGPTSGPATPAVEPCQTEDGTCQEEEESCSVRLDFPAVIAETHNPEVGISAEHVESLTLRIDGQEYSIARDAQSAQLSLSTGNHDIQLIGLNSIGECLSNIVNIEVRTALNKASLKRINKVFSSFVKDKKRSRLKRISSVLSQMSRSGTNPNVEVYNQENIARLQEYLSGMAGCGTESKGCRVHLKNFRKTLRTMLQGSK